MRSVDFPDLVDSAAVVEALDTDAAASASLVGAADSVPDTGASNEFYLSGGQDAGFGRTYEGQNNPGRQVLELEPADDANRDLVRFRFQEGSQPSTVRLTVGLQLPTGFVEQEVHDELSMDPDDPRYLPRILEEESGLVRAIDLYSRSRATHWPRATFTPLRLQGGQAPPLAAWEAAISALETEDAVDLMIAGLQGFEDENLDGVAVQQAMLGHARAQADNAKPRIVLGSVSPEAEGVEDMLAHAEQVRARRFVLVAPSGAEGAVAGLLGHLQYFQSPTFKTIAQPGVELTRSARAS